MTPTDAGVLRVMTWNLLTETATAAPAWRVRAPVVAARVAALAPAVLGTQEGSRSMLDDLVARLPRGYRWVGEGRLGRDRDEHGAVVYDTTALTLLDLRHRWLSPTPECPGSSAPDADLPRMLTSARFHHAVSGAVVTVVNVHLDHLGGRARVDGAAQVAAEVKGSTVVLGDFNDAAERSDAYRILIGHGLADALAPRDRPARRLRTFTGLDPAAGEGDQIDWVLVTPDLTVTEAWVDGGRAQPVPSDHRPVVVDLLLPAQPASSHR
jgi:endonuclease/exonuclease/phosphatase family metal-dependent hydrolase